MIDQAAEVLPRLVDLAMDMTDGISAGTSLHEENSAPGVFRWQYLRGALARLNGATTPRNFSPCGITLDCMTPVRLDRPGQHHPARGPSRAALLGGTKPLGTLWIVSDDRGTSTAAMPAP